MSANPRFKNSQLATATTVLTGSAPQVGAGLPVLMANVAVGTLSAKVVMGVKTSSMTSTPSWQVSTDNSTWLNVKSLSHATQVATAGGTGSTVTTTVVLAGDAVLNGWRFARCIVTTAAGTADGVADSYAINYSWLQAE